jgi:replicative DNA helicase
MSDAQPMFSADNEHCVIGALLLDNNAVDFLDGLQPEHFFLEETRALYVTTRRMIQSGAGCDVVTLAEEMVERNDGENWLPIISDMIAATPSAKNIGRYAKIVIDRATERALIGATGEIQAIVRSKIPTAEKIDRSQALVMALADEQTTEGGRSIDSIMGDVIQRIDDEREGRIVRRPTPWPAINNKVDLLSPGDLIVLAARPAMGKTMLAMNLAESVAATSPVVVFSQEMGDTSLGVRVLASVGRISYEKLLRKQTELTEDDFDRMAVAVKKITGLHLHIDARPARSLHQIRAACRAIKRKHGALGLVVIDYLQIMGGDPRLPRFELVSENSRGLKVLAKELNVPVLALSQLNRSLEGRPNKRPVMSDLRESGQIEQDADVVAFIYRDEVYNPDTADKGLAEIIFGKMREGQITTVPLAFRGEVSRFDSWAGDWGGGMTGATPAYVPMKRGVF